MDDARERIEGDVEKGGGAIDRPSLYDDAVYTYAYANTDAAVPFCWICTIRVVKLRASNGW